jgi:hypothetical protein
LRKGKEAAQTESYQQVGGEKAQDDLLV